MLQPLMPSCRLQDLAQCHDLIMDRASRGRFPLRRRVVSMDTILLCLPSGDLGETKSTEEGKEVEPKTRFMPLDPARAPMAFGDNLVFAFKKLCGLFEGFFIQEFTGSVFVAERQIPALSKLLRQSQTFLLRGRTAIPASEICRALPETAVVTLIDVDFTAMDGMRRHGCRDPAECAILCNESVRV